VVALAAAADGSVVATGDGAGSVRLWQVAPLKPAMEAELSAGSRVTGLAFSPDGRALYVGTQDGPVLRWDRKQARSEPVSSALQAAAIAVDPRGARLALARAGGVEVLALPGGKVVASLARSGPAVGALAWSRDGRVLAGAAPEGVVLWTIGGDPVGSVLRSGAACEMRSVAFHPTAPLLAASGPCELVAWSLAK
jgi:hypothetical protein